MRYLINMDYSFDLNINTLGRRIRTRLYFTSESHLHTVLNVLRFARSEDGKKSLLSEHGIQIVNSTPELCYLTQIVMRVFEDNRRDINDPKRFRVELLFSPGATATPMHMNEMDRESDASRFDTAPLQQIGRDDLTCQDVEDFFQCAIMAGRTDEESYEVATTSTAAEGQKPKKEKSKKDKDKQKNFVTLSAKPIATPEFFPALPSVAASPSESEVDTWSRSENVNGDQAPDVVPSVTIPDLVEPVFDPAPCDVDGEPSARDGDGRDIQNVDKSDRDDHFKKVLARKYFWSSVAIGSFALGMGCLMVAVRMGEDTVRQRRWTSRRR